MESHVECEKDFVVIYNQCGAGLFPQLAWIAYREGSCGDDFCQYGPTPEKAIEYLKEALDIEDVDWEFERREEYRLDAAAEARYGRGEE
jgi:hypothetical protein